MLKKIGIGLLVGLVLVASMTGIVFAANALTEEVGPIDDLFAKLAQKLGLTRETMLQELLDGKTMQDIMADQGLSRDDVMGDWQLRFVRKPVPSVFRLETIAEVLGMEPQALKEAFEDGQTLADVIESQGLDKEDVLADLIALTEEKIKQAQESGQISDDQAQQMMERLENADIGTDWMDKVPPAPHLRQRWLEGVKNHRLILFEDIATALGMEPEELREAFAEGQTLGEIIESKGLEVDEVFEDVKAAIVTRFEGVVEDKEEALAKAEKILEELKQGDFGGAMWERMLDWEGPQPGHRPFNRPRFFPRVPQP